MLNTTSPLRRFATSLLLTFEYPQGGVLVNDIRFLFFLESWGMPFYYLRIRK
jgi:hypothetical protein